MTLYVYSVETMEVLAMIPGKTNDECEDRAKELNFDGEDHGWTYSCYCNIDSSMEEEINEN